MSVTRSRSSLTEWDLKICSTGRNSYIESQEDWWISKDGLSIISRSWDRQERKQHTEEAIPATQAEIRSLQRKKNLSKLREKETSYLWFLPFLTHLEWWICWAPVRTTTVREITYTRRPEWGLSKVIIRTGFSSIHYLIGEEDSKLKGFDCWEGSF